MPNKEKKEEIFTASTEGKADVQITSKKSLTTLDSPHARQ